MFKVVAKADDPDRYNTAGIEKFRSTTLAYEGHFLKGEATVMEAKERYDGQDLSTLIVSPNLSSLRNMAKGLEKNASYFFRDYFNGGLSFQFYDLESFRAYMPKIEQYFTHVLADRGVQGRVLRLNGFDYTLQPTNMDTEKTFLDALRKARDVEVFLALLKGTVSPRELVARIMPCITNALGVDHKVVYDVDEEDVSKLNSIHYDYDQIGILQFQETENGQIYFRRYTHKSKGPTLAYEGILTPDILQKQVCNWLIDALAEVKAINREEMDHLYGRIAKINDVNLLTSPDDPASFLKVSLDAAPDGPLN